MVLRSLGRAEDASDCFGRALVANREIGDRWGEATVLANQASLAMDGGRPSDALALAGRSLRLRLEIGNPWGVALSLEGCAEALAALGRGLDAARLWGRAAAIREDLGSPPAPADAERIGLAQTLTREAVGVESFAEAFEDGGALDDTTATALVSD